MGERRTERQAVLRCLCASTTSVGVEVAGDGEFFLSIRTSVLSQFGLDSLYGAPAA
jgi:hypothetical protein